MGPQLGLWEPSAPTALTPGVAVALPEDPTSLEWLDESYLHPGLAVGLQTR